MKNRNNERVNENAFLLLALINEVLSLSHVDYPADVVVERFYFDEETASKFDQELDIQWDGNHGNIIRVFWKHREQFCLSIMNNGRVLKGNIIDLEHSCVEI